MPGFLVEAFAAALQPPDTRPIWEWAEEHIRIPNSARTRNFHRDTAPWMNEPLERSVDPAVRRLVILGPTGGSKTTLYDIRVPYGIANALGSSLLSMQSDGDADEYCDERLMPILDEAAPVRALAPTGAKGRHKLKKNQRVYPHCSLFVGGAGKSNAQRKSVTFVGVDEAWMVKRGMLAEFEKRTHDRWNGQICVTSQGGNEGEELDEFWKLTDMAEWSWSCPVCRHVQPFKWSRVWYEKVLAADGSTDLNATAATARMLCERTGSGCVAFLPDEVTLRRSLAKGGAYVATNAEKRLSGHYGRHYNALTLYWLSWGKLVTEWVQAREAQADGDPTDFIIFIQKRLAEAYRPPKKTAAVSLTAAEYKLADYWEPGTRIDGEFARFMAIDVQQGHWWALIRAFRANRTSRLLYAAKIESEQMLVHLQERFQVKPGCVLVDCNYEPGLVFNMCARNGWTAVEGDKSQGYPQTISTGGKHKIILRYYSQPNDTAAPEGGICKRILFSRVKVTDETVKLRDNPASGWEHGEDTPADWQKHIVAEEKIETRGESGKPTFKYERIKGRRNDLWWCEVAVTLGAIILQILRPAQLEAEMKAGAPAVDTPAGVAG